MKFLFIILSFLLLTVSKSQNTSLSQSVLSSAAINAQSEETILQATIGQSFTKTSNSDNTVLISGFWGNIAQITLGLDDILPENFSVSNAYPNPFNPTTNIDFSIAEESNLKINIFDLLGRNIFSHEQDFKRPGVYRFQWNAVDNIGNNVASGIYLITIQYKKNTYKQKITFLK